MDKPVTTPFSILGYFQGLMEGLKGSAVGTIAPTSYHGPHSMKGRRKHRGEIRATARRKAYRAHMKGLRE